MGGIQYQWLHDLFIGGIYKVRIDVMAKFNMEVSSNIPGFKEKFNQKGFQLDTEVINWYMKFNIPLDPDTVSSRTMDVTDTEGYILKTNITYNPATNTIMISPIDTYEQNRYYILTVTKRVYSQRGQNLKKEMYIVFKIINNQISNFQVLKSNVKVPKPKARPKDYDERFLGHSRPKSYDDLIRTLAENRLPMAAPKVNILVGIVGLLLTAFSVYLGNSAFILISTAIMVIGLGLIIFQLTNKRNRSLILYNIAVSHFDSGRHIQAKAAFHKALSVDPGNEMAERGLFKLGEYL